MSFEEIRVITVVYVAVFLPLIIYIKNKSKLPGWVPSFYIVGVVVCALGWELWFTYGWVDGDPVDVRRSEALNIWLPKNINWLMNSMGDAGTVLLGGVWLMWISHKKDERVFNLNQLDSNIPNDMIKFITNIDSNLKKAEEAMRQNEQNNGSN
mgnify:CR=1 FL=1